MKTTGRLRRHIRIGRRMQGTSEKPRLVVFRSNKHMYAQLLNDQERKVVVGKSTRDKDFGPGEVLESKNGKEKKQPAGRANKEGARLIGKAIAKKALELGIKEICFDRAGYKYHGRVKALAEGAREGGLKF